jgi:MFS family permease
VTGRGAGTWATLRSFSWPIRLLVINQLGVNVGFYMLVPYLAGYLAEGAGLSAAVVGLVLGARNLSQQGLFLVGGSAADRLGTRGVIIAGCALRTVGFGLFALGSSVPLLLAASVLAGLAGALFAPAVRSYVALAAPDRRAEAFAVFNVFANAGALIGPLAGGLLLLGGFRVTALCAAGVFAVLTVAQALLLPRQPVRRSGMSVLGDWRRCVTDRRFLAFTFALTGMFALQNQLYLVLPLLAERATGQPASVAVLFVVATMVALLFQLRTTRWCARRLGRGRAIALGLALMGAGFLAPLIGPAGTPAHDPAAAALGILPVLAATLFLTVGAMMAQPFVMELIPSFAGESLSGTYFGVFYLASGVVAAGGTAVIGWSVDRGDGTGVPVMALLLCAGLGLACAAAVWLRHRRGLLTPPPTAGAGRTGPTSVTAGEPA